MHHALPLAAKFGLWLIPLEDGRWLSGTPALLGVKHPDLDSYVDELSGRGDARLDCVAIGATPAEAYALAARKAVESGRPGRAADVPSEVSRDQGGERPCPTDLGPMW